MFFFLKFSAVQFSSEMKKLNNYGKMTDEVCVSELSCETPTPLTYAKQVPFTQSIFEQIETFAWKQ